MIESNSSQHSAEILINFKTDAEAIIAYNSLAADFDPPRCTVKQMLSVNGTSLIARFEAPISEDKSNFGQQIRKLRVSISSFFDILTVIIRVMESFGSPISPNSIKKINK